MALTGPGWAARLEIPLRVPLETVRQALAAQLSASSARPGEIYRQGRCRFLTLDAPQLEPLEGRLRLVGPGAAALGIELGGKCSSAQWSGSIELILEPRIDQAGKLRMRIVDSSLTDADGRKALALAWELSKRYLHPRLERFSYDLGNARSALTDLASAVAPGPQRAAMQGTLAQARLLAPRVEPAHLVVPLALELPDAWSVAPVAAAPAAPGPLSEAEVEALEKALEPWDAFLVYAIRQVARERADPALRERLFTLLLECRYELVAILSGERMDVVAAGGDPVRALFVDAWERLREVMSEANYVVLVDAGDALLALDRAAPGLGMRFSADGLRQLARNVRPGDTGDPLAYDLNVDPELQRLFDVPEVPAPPPERSSLPGFVRTGLVRVADEGEKPLKGWVPSQEELPEYEARVGALLKKSAASELVATPLGAPYAKMYMDLVPTTGLIESCWRQYVRRAGKVTYLRSGAGSVGIMQINQHVWRGFYDIQQVRWDAAYNIRAGAQIVMRYMKQYAIPYGEKNGDPALVPRAMYAVYNAGPRAVGRFDKEKRHPREARVDDRLLALYKGIASGAQADLASCGVKGM